MRVYLKSGESFTISQDISEEIIKSMEKGSSKGNFVTVKEKSTTGSQKFVFGIDITEIAAIK